MVALDPDCTEECMLREIARLSSDADKSNYERYLDVFKLPQRRDRELADTFDALRRSTAMRQQTCMQSYELLGAEEFGRF
jgi:hypothetical protein